LAGKPCFNVLIVQPELVCSYSNSQEYEPIL